MMDFDDVPRLFNMVEAVWWIALAMIVLSGRLKVGGLHGWPKWLLVIAFFLFGVSDLIEVRTGAWWKPTSLLVLKVGCIAAFISAVVAVAARQKMIASRDDSDDRTT